MNNNQRLIVHIAGREFSLTCPAAEREEIQLAATYLDEKIQTIKADGKTVDSDRVTMIAALSIAHELLILRDGSSFDKNEIKRRIVALKRKIDEAMANKGSQSM
ncbi:MAG: cell division protein ZapA [Nitrosomonas sp.]|nr:MAG: cell division protein ZapA [Nitrosomonas sp.]